MDRRLPAIALTSLAVVSVGAHARAANQLSVESAIATFDSAPAPSGSSQAFAEAKCKRDSTAVAGGFEAEYRIGDPLSPLIQQTTFRRDQNAWFLAGRNAGAGPGSLELYAYCSSKLDARISYVPGIYPPEQPLVTNRAVCRGQAVALSGGFVTNAVGVVPFALVRANAKKWTVSAANTTAREVGLTAYAVCAKGEVALEAVSASASLAPSGSGSTAVAVASCPKGQRALSGGYEAPSFAEGVLVHRSRLAGKRRWEVAASAQTPVTGTVTAHAYCAPA